VSTSGPTPPLPFAQSRSPNPCCLLLQKKPRPPFLASTHTIHILSGFLAYRKRPPLHFRSGADSISCSDFSFVMPSNRLKIFPPFFFSSPLGGDNGEDLLRVPPPANALRIVGFPRPSSSQSRYPAQSKTSFSPHLFFRNYTASSLWIIPFPPFSRAKLKNISHPTFPFSPSLGKFSEAKPA